MTKLLACPDAEMLSAYLDGKLDATLRGPLEDHISRCEECYFVVRETALTWQDSEEASAPLGGADAPERGAVVVGAFAEASRAEVAEAPLEDSTPVPSPDVPVSAGPVRGVAPGPSGRSFMARYALPLAATLVVAVGAVALWKQTQFGAQDPRAALVAAVGERRFFDARLTGGFKFGERISPKRSGGIAGSGAMGPAAEDWEILAAAAKIRQDSVAPMDGRATAALAASHLFLGEADQGIQLLQQSLVVPSVSEQERARLLSDLSGALLIRGTQANDAGDLERALVNAESALRDSDSPSEALHNKALALELLGRPVEAAAAWEACAAREEDPGWRGEALKRRAMLLVR